MKNHTQEFKEQIKNLGRQQDVLIEYTINDEKHTLTVENINSVTPSFESDLLKSVMKQLEIDSNINIPLGTEISFKWGLLVNGAFEYLDYGKYIVYSSEKQEDNNSYIITCYDKLINSMKDYEKLDITYPITVREYIIKLAEKLGLEFKNAEDKFVNYDKELTQDFFEGIGFTYRDVLDDLAEVTASVICLDNEDKLELRDINDTAYYKIIEGENINIQDSINLPFEVSKVTGNSVQETEPTPEAPVEIQNVGDNVNLFDIQEYIDFYSLTVTGNDDGHDYVAYTTKGYENNKFMQGQFKENTQYTLSFYGRQKTTYQGVTTGFRFYYTDGTYKEKYVNNNEIWTKYTIVTDKNKTVDYILMLWAYGGTIWLSDIKLEEGITPSSYTPYNCGNVNITVCNKNLANLEIVSTQYRANTEKINNNTFKVTKTEEGGTYYGQVEMYLQKGKQYTVFLQAEGENSADATISLCKDYNGVGYIQRNIKNYYTFNTEQEKLVIIMCPTTATEITFKIMIIEGSDTNQEFIDNQQQTITFPLSEGQKLMKGDYLANDGIHHVRKQVELVGTENWQQYNNRIYLYIENAVNIVSSEDIPDIKSNMFKPIQFNNISSSPDNSITYNLLGNSDKHKGISFYNNKYFNDVSTIKSWLAQQKQAGKPVIVEYELAEEVIEPYTEEQQEAYNQINSLYSYDEVTNIFSNNEISPIFEVQYAYEMETIDEEYLKDTNVNFGETFGPINSVVLSRSTSDNIYRKDYESEEKYGLCEIKISDNQIMNNNDRDQYIDGIFNKLRGLTYPVCDFTSTGVMYIELLDRFFVKIGENKYPVVMFNNEQDITQGLEEQIYADKSENSETDYTKADKTDQKINQTNLIVDKQNQSIQGIITQIGDRSEKETSITADIDGLASKVSDIEDVTETVEGNNSITLENCVAGPLLELHIYGNNTVFDQLYISDNLIISDDLIIYGDSRIQVTNTQIGSEESTTKVYELGVTDVLRQKGDIYDEYVLDNKQAKVIRRINKDGTVKTVPEEEIIGDYNIELLEGTNTITIQNYNAKLKAKFAFKNDYTDIFATRVEMESSITQTAEEINLEVRKKVDENEVISKINQSAEEIQIEANKISLKR